MASFISCRHKHLTCTGCQDCFMDEPDATTQECDCGRIFEPVSDLDTVCDECKLEVYDAYERFYEELTDAQAEFFSNDLEGVHPADYLTTVIAKQLILEKRVRAMRERSRRAMERFDAVMRAPVHPKGVAI